MFLSPRFVKHQRVITTNHGIGVVRWVYPPARDSRSHKSVNIYSVLPDGRKKPIIAAESELRPA